MLESFTQHLISRFMGALARWRFRLFKNWAIKRLIRKHQVDMSCVQEQDIEKYQHFNHFFTRALKPESRPIDTGLKTIVSPVDGTISQIGYIHDGNLIQAKGMSYTVEALLGRSEVDGLNHGSFVTLYLAPRDYHRVHMPFDGDLIEMVYVPGQLFSVQPKCVESVHNLFARNERLICFFQTRWGVMVQVLVGAMVVGSIKTPWQGIVTGQPRQLKRWDYRKQPIHLKKGEEMGCFLLGSTVITLFPEGFVWDKLVKAGDCFKFGERLGAYQK